MLYQFGIDELNTKINILKQELNASGQKLNIPMALLESLSKDKE